MATKFRLFSSIIHMAVSLGRPGLRRAMMLGSFFLALVLSVPNGAWALPLFDTFGPLDQATFGGQGIPNQEVAVSTQWEADDVLITVAMSATQRYSNPALTNDGAGTYFAGTGTNFGGAGESTIEGALWNFNYYINVEGLNGATPVLGDYQIDLYYDFNPGLETPPGLLGVIDVTTGLVLSGGSALTLIEGSENLLFGYLSTADIYGVVTPPPGSFDPNALGEYNFAIQVSHAGWNVEAVRMDVQVVPEPSTAILFGMGLMGLAASRRKN